MLRVSMARLLPLLSLALAVAANAQAPAPAGSTADAPAPAANPARPTLSVPAVLPPAGYLQFEQGLNRAETSPSGTLAQTAVNQTVKLALTSRLLVDFLWQPYTRNTVLSATDAAEAGSNFGDLDAGGQAVLLKSTGPRPTVDVGYQRRLRAGTAANLDIGDFSQSGILYCSGDLPHGLHYDSNLQFNEQSSDQNSTAAAHTVRRAQYVQTLALSHAIFAKATAGRLSAVAELQHDTQPFVTASAHGRPLPGVRANAVDLLLATPFALRPNLVLDLALTRGLTSTSTEWQGTAGFTYLLPHRLYAHRHAHP